VFSCNTQKQLNILKKSFAVHCAIVPSYAARFCQKQGMSENFEYLGDLAKAF
jgi:hypothetical protein